MNTEYLDIENWNRKKHFYFFREYEQPFFNLCANLEVTSLKKHCRENKISFSVALLYLSLQVANRIPEFRYRIHQNKVVIHPVLHGGSTIFNKDETFSFCYFSFSEDFSEFQKNWQEMLVKHEESPTLDPQENREDLIHYSILPWVSFTSVSHARRFGQEDSIPKIMFGKYFSPVANEEKILLPVSVEVHHALMDGWHVGKFFQGFQEKLEKNPLL